MHWKDEFKAMQAVQECEGMAKQQRILPSQNQHSTCAYNERCLSQNQAVPDQEPAYVRSAEKELPTRGVDDTHGLICTPEQSGAGAHICIDSHFEPVSRVSQAAHTVHIHCGRIRLVCLAQQLLMLLVLLLGRRQFPCKVPVLMGLCKHNSRGSYNVLPGQVTRLHHLQDSGQPCAHHSS